MSRPRVRKVSEGHRENTFPLAFKGYGVHSNTDKKIRLAMVDSALSTKATRCAVCGRSVTKANPKCAFLPHRTGWR